MNKNKIIEYSKTILMAIIILIPICLISIIIKKKNQITIKNNDNNNSVIKEKIPEDYFDEKNYSIFTGLESRINDLGYYESFDFKSTNKHHGCFAINEICYYKYPYFIGYINNAWIIVEKSVGTNELINYDSTQDLLFMEKLLNIESLSSKAETFDEINYKKLHNISGESTVKFGNVKISVSYPFNELLQYYISY